MIGLMPSGPALLLFGVNQIVEVANSSSFQVGDVGVLVQAQASSVVPAAISGWTTLMTNTNSRQYTNPSNGNVSTLYASCRVSFKDIESGDIGASYGSMTNLYRIRNSLPVPKPLTGSLASSPLSASGMKRPISVLFAGASAPTVNGAAPDTPLNPDTAFTVFVGGNQTSVSVECRVDFWTGDYTGQTLTLSPASGFASIKGL